MRAAPSAKKVVREPSSASHVPTDAAAAVAGGEQEQEKDGEARHREQEGGPSNLAASHFLPRCSTCSRRP